MPSSGAGRMVKARLEEHDGSNPLEFQFNPSEYSVKKSATWNAAGRSMNTKAGAKPNYVSSNPQSISLQIFFDGWESDHADVTGRIDQLLDWCTPTRASMNDKPEPPVLKLHWGSNHQLENHKFYLESVSAKYTMFSAEGKPLRATADINLKEVPDDPPPQNPTSGSIHARRTHLITDGDSLQSIAQAEYGNPNLWRGLANFNDIDDPLRLSSGSRVLLPSPEEAAARLAK
ncbi:MAG TPA: peptidase M23 [Candidatus Dormibacteraeota bacterium]